MRAWILVACLALVSPQVTSVRPREDPIVQLETLVTRLRTRRAWLEGPTLVSAKGLLADTRLLWSVDPTRAEQAARVLLDVAGLYADATADPHGSSPESELRQAAVDTLEAHFDATFGRWLVAEVLALPASQPLTRRIAVARLLETHNVPSAKLPLLAAAAEADPGLRRAARRALVGWEDDAVHGYFLGLLAPERSAKDPDGAWLAEKHFSGVHFPSASRISGAYAELVRADLVSPDWRTASRAVSLQTPLSNEVALPPLIEALAIWKARARAGAQSLRVRFELRRALRARSGRAFGLEPEDWRAWWASMRGGGSRGVAPQSIGGPQESTEASFFGIRPASDRIVFVLDRSGSMNEIFAGTVGVGERAPRKRWKEAQEQLFGFLEAIGPTARFDVILFHTIPEIWEGQLVPADASHVQDLRAWLGLQVPNGGTRLRPAIESALRVDAHGQVDLAHLEADTVIVLCDGETEEGAAWIGPFLQEHLPTTRVVFHGVQVGPGGDESLERLAKESHGDFVRIDG